MYVCAQCGGEGNISINLLPRESLGARLDLATYHLGSEGAEEIDFRGRAVTELDNEPQS
jgi:hypothetical protein